MSKKNKIKIEKVGELKELLNKFDDNLFINFGTKKDGFEIDSYGVDMLSVSLMSSDLEEFTNNILSFNINNNQKIELKQTKDDGSVFVITKDNTKTETTRIISAGDFITMLNWYTYQKSIGNTNLEF